MTITEGDWERLAADEHTRGVTVRRIHPESVYDIFIAIRHPDNCRMLTLRIQTRDADEALRRMHALPQTRGIEMQLVRLSEGGSELRIVLTDGSLHEVFNPLADDIASSVHNASSAVGAVLAAVDRFEHWRLMLERLADSGLAPQARRGLYGELVVLRDFLLPAMPAPEAVRAWTGPTAANQDFQLPAAAIEVKTSSGKEPQQLVIANERELDEHGTATLILAHLSLDERRGGTGESLNTAVDRTRALVTAPSAAALLDDLLVRAGYLALQRALYDEPRYTVRKQHFWHVTGDFPRITEADLRAGVGDCRYHISSAGLDEFLMTEAQVDTAIAGGLADE
jgi:Putative  PD-(D/E)XK family member, (DUF4420)